MTAPAKNAGFSIQPEVVETILADIRERSQERSFLPAREPPPALLRA